MYALMDLQTGLHNTVFSLEFNLVSRDSLLPVLQGMRRRETLGMRLS